MSFTLTELQNHCSNAVLIHDIISRTIDSTISEHMHYMKVKGSFINFA